MQPAALKMLRKTLPDMVWPGGQKFSGYDKIFWLCIFFGPDQTEGIKFGPPDRTRYLYLKLMRIVLAISDLRKFRHLNLIN